MATDNADKTQVDTGHDPAFWVRHAHSAMREQVTALVNEIGNIPISRRKNLLGIADQLVSLLDELTKLDKGGFRMVPPRPPVAPPAISGDNEGMEDRVKNLENFALETRDRLTRIETKMDALATKDALANLKADRERLAIPH